MDNDQLDEIRRGLQESFIQSKKDKLRDNHGMEFEFTDPQLSPEMESEWLDNVLEFEEQFDAGKTITVRERIGNPSITPLKDMSIYALDQAITELLELMIAHGISVDFLGEVDNIEAYRYLTEELLDYEIDDIRVEGYMTCFTHTSLEYDVQMWVHNFVLDLFVQDK